MQIGSKKELVVMLMNRDHISALEAKRMVAITQQLINEVVEDGGSLDDVEEILSEHLGLELDYIFLFI